ncbi:uncharacterized protein LOC142504972 [Primulina tabacum]|uniref:uncharacterized protein LOC142504972 n=1 Tax=Primulina tabacum TaxID=48773 RepID=UPI003F5AA111
MAQPGQEEVWIVFVDGEASKRGSGIEIVLVSPTGEKAKVAAKLDFRASNNEAEYESIVMGMKTAREAGATRIIIYSDSQLVIQSIKDSYEMREGRMKEYLGIHREENAEADSLAKMASSLTAEGEGGVIQSTRLVSSIETSPAGIQGDSWMTPLLDYFLICQLPEDPQQAQRIKRQGPRFSIINEESYRQSFQGPLLKCLVGEETEYVLKDIHEGCCGDHLGSIELTRKALLAGIWWPTMSLDAREMVRTCERCQRYGNFSHSLASSMKPIQVFCPFNQ